MQCGVFTTQCYAELSIAVASHLSVCDIEVVWFCSKINTHMVRLGFILGSPYHY